MQISVALHRARRQPVRRIPSELQQCNLRTDYRANRGVYDRDEMRDGGRSSLLRK